MKFQSDVSSWCVFFAVVLVVGSTLNADEMIYWAPVSNIIRLMFISIASFINRMCCVCVCVSVSIDKLFSWSLYFASHNFVCGIMYSNIAV